MKLRSKLLTCAVGVFGLLASSTAASAGSISAGSLTLTLDDSPFFVKGVQETLNDICGTGNPANYYQGGVVRQPVAATSLYGIKSWDVAQSYNYDAPGPWTHYAQSARPVIQYSRNNFDSSDCGGGISNGQGVIVRVTDNHGNVAELENIAQFDFTRWDNTSASATFGNGSFSFGAAWAANTPCAQCDNGSTAYVTKAGASAVFTLAGNWTQYNNAVSGHLGLNMTKGPGHGAVKLYLDGVYKATVDTYSKTWQYRTYVWDFGPLTANAHTVKLVNVGTKGRPRIDVQGMGLVSGSAFTPICDPDTC